MTPAKMLENITINGDTCFLAVGGQVVQFDLCDLECVKKYCLRLKKNKNGYYVQTFRTVEYKKYEYSMLHRVLMQPDRSEVVDHKNRNPLDNRRSNLRNCTRTENNQHSISSGKAKFKGVRYYRYGQKNWMARIVHEKKELILGYFSTPLEAAKAYNVAAKKYFGEFALLNKV